MCVTVSRDEVNAVWGRISTTVRKMADITANVNTWEDLKPNYSACNKYNPQLKPELGCPFKKMCGVDVNTRMKQMFSNQGDATMSLAKKLNEKPSSTIIEDAEYVEMSKKAVETPLPPPTAPQPAPQLQLFVDCVPVKVDRNIVLLRLEDMIATRSAPICEKHRVKDVREIPYGAGTVALVASFKTDPPQGVMIASSGGLSNQIIEALIPLSSLVVRGLR